jgi:O-antigen/teichoic acid export membrane protein
LNESIPSRASLLRLFSSAIADQVLLSAASFVGGVLMLRRVSDVDYGLYVLVTSALLLITGMQDALISSPMLVIAAKRKAPERLGMSVDLLRRQYIFWLPLMPAALLALAMAYWRGHSYAATAGMITTGVALLIMAREHLRQMLLLYNKPGLLLTADAVYAVVFLGGIYAATRSRLPVHFAILGVGAATLLSTLTSMNLFRRAVGWRDSGQHALRQVWRLGKWGLTGCILTWLHSQGFYYVLAALKGADMVAGVAASRLLLMPINLLFAGVGQLLLPMASGWQERNGTHEVIRRMTGIGAVIFGAALCHFSLVWVFRAWIVVHVFRHPVGALDPLLLMWGAAFLVTTLRSFAMVVLQAQERFASLVFLAFISTTSSLALCWWGIRHYGAVGSVLGIILGEGVDLFGIIWLIRRRRPGMADSSRNSVLILNEVTEFAD